MMSIVLYTFTLVLSASQCHLICKHIDSFTAEMLPLGVGRVRKEMYQIWAHQFNIDLPDTYGVTIQSNRTSQWIVLLSPDLVHFLSAPPPHNGNIYLSSIQLAIFTNKVGI